MWNCQQTQDTFFMHCDGLLHHVIDVLIVSRVDSFMDVHSQVVLILMYSWNSSLQMWYVIGWSDEGVKSIWTIGYCFGCEYLLSLSIANKKKEKTGLFLVSYVDYFVKGSIHCMCCLESTNSLESLEITIFNHRVQTVQEILFVIILKNVSILLPCLLIGF